MLGAPWLASCSSGDGSARGPYDECDPLLQDCADPDKRCIIDRGTTETGPHTTCDDFFGDQGETEVCERPTDELGMDTCAARLVCVIWEMPYSDPQLRQCLPYCHSDGDCAAGEQCMSLSGSQWTGACTRTCDLFGDDCSDGTGCYSGNTLTGWSSLCVPEGSGQISDPCTYSNDCAPGMTCVIYSTGNECMPVCDDAHPCESGTCTAFIGDDSPFGAPDHSYCDI